MLAAEYKKKIPTNAPKRFFLGKYYHGMDNPNKLQVERRQKLKELIDRIDMTYTSRKA